MLEYSDLLREEFSNNCSDHSLPNSSFLNRRKARKEQDRRDAVEASRLAEQKKTGGRGLTALSGRDLFSFDPTLFVDDVAAAGEDDYQEDEDYWQQVLNDNQATVDQANRDANIESDDDQSDNNEDEQSMNIIILIMIFIISCFSWSIFVFFRCCCRAILSWKKSGSWERRVVLGRRCTGGATFSISFIYLFFQDLDDLDD